MDVVATRANSNAVVAILDIVVLEEKVGPTRTKPVSIERERLQSK